DVLTTADQVLVRTTRCRCTCNDHGIRGDFQQAGHDLIRLVRLRLLSSGHGIPTQCDSRRLLVVQNSGLIVKLSREPWRNWQKSVGGRRAGDHGLAGEKPRVAFVKDLSGRESSEVPLIFAPMYGTLYWLMQIRNESSLQEP